MTKTSGKVIDVELNPDAVKDAISNAKCNNAENARFYCADTGETFDVVFMDLPRSGNSKKLSIRLPLPPRKRLFIFPATPKPLQDIW